MTIKQTKWTNLRKEKAEKNMKRFLLCSKSEVKVEQWERESERENWKSLELIEAIEKSNNGLWEIRLLT